MTTPNPRRGRVASGGPSSSPACCPISVLRGHAVAAVGLKKHRNAVGPSEGNIVEPIYDSIRTFAEGKAQVTRGGVETCIDLPGQP